MPLVKLKLSKYVRIIFTCKEQHAWKNGMSSGIRETLFDNLYIAAVTSDI